MLCSPAFVFEKADSEAAFEGALEKEKGLNALDSTEKRAVFLRAASSGSCRNLQGCDLMLMTRLMVGFVADG